MGVIIQKNGLADFAEAALINQLKGLQSSELDTFVKRNIFQLTQINDCAKKALESLNGSVNYTKEGLFTNVNDQLDNEEQNETIQSNLKNCIQAEDARLKERFGLIFGTIATIFSRLFGTIGETHKIIASLAAIPTFANSTISHDSLAGLVPAKLEFESADLDQTSSEYKDL